MLRQLVPTAATIAMLVETDTLEARIERRDVEVAAQALGQQLIIAPFSSEDEFDGAFTAGPDETGSPLQGGQRRARRAHAVGCQWWARRAKRAFAHPTTVTL